MKIAVIGLGYVGLPLAMVFAEAGTEVVGVEAVAARCDEINAGRSYIQDVQSDALKAMVDKGLISATADYAATEDCDADIICLPTPLNANREPDLTLVKDATVKLAGHLRRGQLVTLESTTYPGTTRDELAPLLEAGSGLTAGVDFHLAFSPERVDPGRTDYTTKSTPKVVGGLTPACTARALEVYGPALDNVVPVSTPEVAEMTKLLENIFRSVNIALMNELAMLCANRTSIGDAQRGDPGHPLDELQASDGAVVREEQDDGHGQGGRGAGQRHDPDGCPLSGRDAEDDEHGKERQAEDRCEKGEAHLPAPPGSAPLGAPPCASAQRSGQPECQQD